MKMPFEFSNGRNINLKMAFPAIIYRQALFNGKTIQIYVQLNYNYLINFIKFLLILQSGWSVSFFISFIYCSFKFFNLGIQWILKMSLGICFFVSSGQNWGVWDSFLLSLSKVIILFSYSRSTWINFVVEFTWFFAAFV